MRIMCSTMGNENTYHDAMFQVQFLQFLHFHDQKYVFFDTFSFTKKLCK